MSDKKKLFGLVIENQLPSLAKTMFNYASFIFWYALSLVLLQVIFGIFQAPYKPILLLINLLVVIAALPVAIGFRSLIETGSRHFNHVSGFMFWYFKADKFIYPIVMLVSYLASIDLI